ncbi:MAG: hypothetical protein WBJ54_04885, partial [Syntrophorhabdus sp.]
MKKVLFVAGSGGHIAQLAIILQEIGDKYDSKLMLEKSDKLGIERFSRKYKIFTAIPIRGKNESIVITLIRILVNLFQSSIILLRSNPEYIITT